MVPYKILEEVYSPDLWKSNVWNRSIDGSKLGFLGRYKGETMFVVEHGVPEVDQSSKTTGYTMSKVICGEVVGYLYSSAVINVVELYSSED